MSSQEESQNETTLYISSWETNQFSIRLCLVVLKWFNVLSTPMDPEKLWDIFKRETHQDAKEYTEEHLQPSSYVS